MVLIAPSILAADFARLGEAIEKIQTLGAALIHIDVMDGHFGPEITGGQPVVHSLRQATELELDVHLLIERPERYVRDFVRAGADRLALHAEATPDIYRAVKLVKEQGVRAGLALNPGTPLQSGFSLLKELDYLLILGAPALGGEEEFLGETIDKVKAAARERERQGLDFAIEVEGGIGPEQAEQLALAGADILVVGSDILDSNERGKALRQWVRSAGRDLSAGRQETKPRVQ
jgi:ribulose-phosphate 3-epimerase